MLRKMTSEMSNTQKSAVVTVSGGVLTALGGALNSPPLVRLGAFAVSCGTLALAIGSHAKSKATPTIENAANNDVATR
ncbi:MAG: hypothetical protein GY804_15200 [Alphaproteobacteria bacterium]|nr:hypothetical protein [Alphaproteobacteria bacterium]